MTESYHHIERIDASSPRSVARAVARLHTREIPQGFLPSLGTRFLAQLYLSIASSRHAFLFVARAQGEVSGFICGATDTRGLYQNFARTRAPLAAALALPRLIRPRHLRRAWETWRYPSQQPSIPLPDAEILNFCVCSNHQRLGIGRQLFSALENEFCRRQVDRIKIVTGASQGSAQKFYESLGAELAARIEVHRGESSYVYTHCITNEGSPTNQHLTHYAA